jgi:hypothetical protein
VGGCKGVNYTSKYGTSQCVVCSTKEAKAVCRHHLFLNEKWLFMKQLHFSQGVELFMNNNVTVLEASTQILNAEDDFLFL